MATITALRFRFIAHSFLGKVFCLNYLFDFHFFPVIL